MSEETETEEEKEKGIQAIIYLQKLRGIEETHREAEIGWYKMEEFEKDQTMMAYGMMKH